jgi:cell division protein FtsL
MRRVRVKKVTRIGRFEKLLYTLAVVLMLGSPISIVFSKATLSKVNYDVEKEKQKITSQQKTNESLAMTINELASLTKIQQVAQEQGLSYNNSNIKTVTEDK